MFLWFQPQHPFNSPPWGLQCSLVYSFTTLSCGAGVILVSKSSVFSWQKIRATIFAFNGSGRQGWEINLYQGGGGLEVVSLGKHLFAHPLPPAPTTHSNFKSNMAGWINNGKLVRLASTNKTPALQAITTLLSMNLPHHLSSKVDINLSHTLSLAYLLWFCKLLSKTTQKFPPHYFHKLLLELLMNLNRTIYLFIIGNSWMWIFKDWVCYLFLIL